MPAHALARELAALTDLQPEAQLLLDREGRILHANAGAAALLGGTPAALRDGLLQDHLDAAGPTAAELVRQALRGAQATPVHALFRPAAGAAGPRRMNGQVASLRGGEASIPVVWLRLTPHAEGVHRFLALNARLEASAREIARRQRVEEELRAQRSWLEVLLISIGDAVLACDLDGRVVFLNPVAERVTGWTRAEAQGRDVTEVVPLVQGDGGPPAPNPVHTVLEERRAVTLAEHTRLVARDGRVIPIDDAATPIVDADGRLLGAVLVFRDIGPRVRAEQERAAMAEQLREAQKMEAIGRLAGGIAHDFNNVVAAILANAGMVREALPPGDALQPLLHNLQSAGLRARSLVQQILAFSRRQPRRLRAQVLQLVVDEAVALLRSTLPSGVQIATRLVAEPLRAQIDATPFVQVLLNLGTNAWQAMPDGRGEIAIGLDVVSIGDDAPPPGLVPGLRRGHRGPHARLTVRDNGRGMDAATRAKAFEPFFTTKAPGEGTGLGLAVVHGIVAEHHGLLALDTAPGAGACFSIYLPLAPEADDTRPSPLDGDGAPDLVGDAAGCVVAYVDDEEIMRLTVEALLRRAGYEVLCFAGGAAALRALQDASVRCDVLVTDFNMPQISGLELAQALRPHWPALPIVITSGYVTPALVEGAAAVEARLLHKEQSYERLLPLIASLVPRP